MILYPRWHLAWRAWGGAARPQHDRNSPTLLLRNAQFAAYFRKWRNPDAAARGQISRFSRQGAIWRNGAHATDPRPQRFALL